MGIQLKYKKTGGHFLIQRIPLKFILLILLHLSICSILFSQSSSENYPDLNGYIINERVYDINGLSRVWALENELKLEEETTFGSYDAMMNFVGQLEQDLRNLRLYSKVETTLTEQESPRGDLHLYSLTISLEDAWTFIPLAYPKYDTNTNLTLESKILYSNLFGTLVEFQVDSYIEVAPKDDSNGIGTGLWEIETSFDNINWGEHSYSLQWIQKHDRITKSNTKETVEDYTYNESLFLVGTDFFLSDKWTYTAAPGMSFRYLYNDLKDTEDDSFDKDPFSFSLNQNLVYNSLNWYGNFREGLYSDLSLQLQLSFFADTRLKGMTYVESGWHHIIGERMAFSLRSVFVQGIREELADLGSYMRGVPDQNLYGESAFFMNSSLPLKAVDLENLIELQISPFMDWGLTKRKEEAFSNDQDFRLSSGFSTLFFFDKLTSIQVRTSFGWDLASGNSDEDSFEFMLSTSLFY